MCKILSSTSISQLLLPFHPQVLPYVIETVRVIPLLVLPLIHYFGGGSEILVPIGVLVFFAFVGVLSAAAVVNTGKENPGFFEKIAR